MQLAGGVTGAQVRPMTLGEVAVAVRPPGAGGTVLQGGVTGVLAVACDEAADVPSASTASTLK